MVPILQNYMPLKILHWKQIQGNESKDTVTRPEVSEVDPQEKQKVTRSELSKLIKENKKSKVNRYAQPNRGKVKKLKDILYWFTYLDLVYKHPRRVSQKVH